jgi:mannose/fructose-specific phosphotransferase system component IIA
MLLEVVLGRDNVELKDLIKTATEAGTKGINIFELKEKQHEDDNLDDGI